MTRIPLGLTSCMKWPSPGRERPFLEKCGAFLQTGLLAPHRWAPMCFLGFGCPLLCPLHRWQSPNSTGTTELHIFPSEEVAACLQYKDLMPASNCSQHQKGERAGREGKKIVPTGPNSLLSDVCPRTLPCGFPGAALLEDSPCSQVTMHSVNLDPAKAFKV